MRRNFMGFEHGQGRRIRNTTQPISFMNAIEPSDKIDVALLDAGEINVRNVQTALLGEPHDGKLCAADRIGVILRREFCDPRTAAMRSRHLGTGTSQRRSGLQYSPEV